MGYDDDMLVVDADAVEEGVEMEDAGLPMVHDSQPSRPAYSALTPAEMGVSARL
jgi:hypothetical protein